MHETKRSGSKVDDNVPGLLKLVVVDVSLILDLEQKRLLNALRN